MSITPETIWSVNLTTAAAACWTNASASLRSARVAHAFVVPLSGEDGRAGEFRS
jgi:hypothetical protein